MKKTGLLCLVLLFLLGCLPALAADEPLTFCDATETPDITGALGYPRFARLKDGSLMLSSSGNVFISKSNGKTWTKYAISGFASKTATSSTNTKHELARENWQPFVLPDGRVLMAYRARTNISKEVIEADGLEFYTSIRVMISDDATGTTYGNEQILIEDVSAGEFKGFWEPYMIQLDENTVALYYADDLHESGYQYIKFITYNIKTNEWNTTPQIAVDGVTRKSRDGMPAVTQLIDGSFAMVVEASNVYKYYPTNFAIALFRSEDGVHWDTVPTIVARPDYTPHQCAAPFIATLPDGRVVITYMTTEDYVGTIKSTEKVYNSVFGMIVSDEPLTYETVLTDSTKGAAAGFTELVSPFDEVQNGYQVWNTVFYSNGELYVAGSAGVNTSSTTRTGQKLVIRRADVSLPGLFAFASVTLENDLAINFYAKEAQFAGYENILVRFTAGGETVEVSEYTTRKVGETDYRVYRYDGINATQMGKEVTAQIVLSRKGVAVSGKAAVYSVKTYATNMLARTEDATLKTLLVDLLNYGAAAQTYCGVDTDSLVNKDLTEEQKNYATQGDPALQSVKAVSDVGDKPITAEAVSLSVGSHVEINYYFNKAGYTGTADDLRLQVTYAGQTEILGSEAFETTGSGWKVSFTSLNATELSETVTAMVISAANSEALSNTVTYSVESYAKSMENHEDAALVRLVKNMMKYGNSAAAYFAAKEG